MIQGDSLPLNISLPATAETRLRVIKSPEASEATITEHWGQRDQPAVAEYVVNRFREYRIVMLGHSVGGEDNITRQA